MNVTAWSLRLRIFLFFALIAGGSALIIGGAMWLAAGRIGSVAVEPLVLMGGAAALGVTLLTGWVWQLFDTHVARPIEALSGELSASSHGGGAGAIRTESARYLGALAPAARELAGALGTARNDEQSRVADAVGEMLAEKAQLEAVLRDLRECVLICNAEHEILLYNSEAQRLLGGEGGLGLGRSLFGLITEQPVVHALDRLSRRLGSQRYRTHRDYLSVGMVCATRDGRRTLQGRIALILDAGGDKIDGFVATFHDATALIADEAARDHLLKDTLEALRQPAANLKAAIELIQQTPDMVPEVRARFMSLVFEETDRLARALEGLGTSYNELRVGGWSMNDVSSEALAACAADRLSGSEAPGIAHDGPRRWMHCDSFTVVELLATVAERLGREAGARQVSLTAAPDGPHVMLDLVWQGGPADFADRDDWLDSPLIPSLGTLSIRDVLGHHRTTLWGDDLAGGRHRLRLPLPPAVEDHESAPAEVLPARPEFYDFRLLTRSVPADAGETRLGTAVFTVFDTETTGLFPSAGDEIVQVAGVRVLNGRLIRGEIFDRLVDPGRRIPAASTRIHGITDDMVAGEGDARRVLPIFHDFASGSFLVAHNAPFDLKFLRLKEGVTGRRFDQPVLDTVLLSAWLFGQSAEHTLDALCARFGIAIPTETRHTALTDALATAEVLCRLIPALSERGIATLGDALRISEEAGAIRRRQAQY